ncbi:MAG: F0F1 ATP synthase subunit B [Candidatus Izemoplasmatales bacterium]|nr:F0F1 ATP synthase subunit B [Candidatus Izemoplasmatales bacterium]
MIDRMLEAVNKAIESALGVNLVDMLIQIGATLILVLIVKFFFWGRITEFLEKRKNIMTDEMESAKKENLAAQELKEKREQEYNKLKLDSKEYLESAKSRAEQERLRIIEEAKKNADQMMERTKKEIEAEKIKAKSTLKKEVVDLAAVIAEKIIKQEVDEKKYQDMIVDDFESSENS